MRHDACQDVNGFQWMTCGRETRKDAISALEIPMPATSPRSRAQKKDPAMHDNHYYRK
jgi:hypothetical protein